MARFAVPCGLRKFAYSFFSKLVWRDVRPHAMYRGNRPVVNDFDDNEWLFFRWFSDWFDGGEKLRPAMVPMPDQSVNRTKHQGRSWFVLMPEPTDNEERKSRNLCMGIVRVKTNELPTDKNENGKNYSFRVEHDPSDHNYQHCEIRIYVDGQHLVEDNKKFFTEDPSGARRRVNADDVALIKKHYRTLMADKAAVYLRPEVATKKASLN